MNRAPRHFGTPSSLPSGGLLLVLRLLPPGGI
jgi:hypothetical protein